MVLFLFIIMLLDVTAAEHVPRQKIWMGCTVIVAIGFIYLVARVLGDVPMGARTVDSLPTTTATIQTYPRVTPQEYKDIQSGKLAAPPAVTLSNDDTHQIGRLLFSRYVAPFEVTSLLILVATIGVIVLCKEDAPVRRPTNKEVDGNPHPKTGVTLTR